MSYKNKTTNEDKPYYEKHTWTNTHRNISVLPERYYDVWNRDGSSPLSMVTFQNWRHGLTNLKNILAEAERNKKRIRATGSGYSLSDVAISNHYMVNTVPLDIVFIGLPGRYLMSPKNKEYYVFTQCGTNISQLNQWLSEKGLALPTCGSSDGQTIVGAMSTGTHGAAINVGSVQDYILGIHLLTASNESYWIEGLDRILSDEGVQAFCNDSVTRINDEIIFNSLLVSFGSFGLIASVLLKAEPLYRLELFQKKYPIANIKACLTNPFNLAPLSLPINPHHVEFVVNPYKKEEAIARIMYKRIDFVELLPEISYGLGLDIVEVFGKVADSIPLSVNGIMLFLDKFISDGYPDINGKIDYPGNIFRGTHGGFIGKGMSTEFGVDVKDAERTLDIIYKTASKKPLPGILGVRFVKASQALLSIAKFGTTCTFEIPAAFSKTSEVYYVHLWDSLDNAGINYTFHCGQMNNLTAEKVKMKWGNPAVKSWIDCRNRLLKTPEQRDRFANDFLIRCGLHN